MSALEAFVEDLSKEVPVQLIEAVKEAAKQREGVYGGTVDADLVEIHAHLVKNRSHIERLEYLTSTLSLLKSRTANRLADAKAAYDDKYANAAAKPTLGFDNYTSAKEKDASANLAATEELFVLRKAERLHRDVDASWNYCRVLLHGAEGAQRDIETRIRLISITNSLGG